MTKTYAIVLANDMKHPLYIKCESIDEFWHKIREIMVKYGEVELIYQVYGGR